jgi:hypothetical protein
VSGVFMHELVQLGTAILHGKDSWTAGWYFLLL